MRQLTTYAAFNLNHNGDVIASSGGVSSAHRKKANERSIAPLPFLMTNERRTGRTLEREKNGEKTKLSTLLEHLVTVIVLVLFFGVYLVPAFNFAKAMTSDVETRPLY